MLNNTATWTGTCKYTYLLNVFFLLFLFSFAVLIIFMDILIQTRVYLFSTQYGNAHSSIIVEMYRRRRGIIWKQDCYID